MPASTHYLSVRTCACQQVSVVASQPWGCDDFVPLVSLPNFLFGGVENLFNILCS